MGSHEFFHELVRAEHHLDAIGIVTPCDVVAVTASDMDRAVGELFETLSGDVVRVGDEVRLRHDGRERVVIVSRIITKRVGAPVAAECYVDKSPPPPPREQAGPVAVRDRGAGRPTKRERRSIEKLLGRRPRPE